jgi:hypothetical protein
VLAFLYDMESDRFIKTEEAYQSGRDEQTHMSWAFCPLTYMVYIKQQDLIQQWRIREVKDQLSLEIVKRVRFTNT